MIHGGGEGTPGAKARKPQEGARAGRPLAVTRPSVHHSSQLMEARDEKRLLKLQARLQNVKLLIVDELGYVPLTKAGAELLFEVFTNATSAARPIVTSNLPFDEWTIVFRSERLTGALLDRLTHHVHILEINGDSYRLKQSAGRRRASAAEHATPPPA